MAIVLTAAPGEVSGRRLLADAALVALAANLGNLLDRAPGRTIKVGLLAVRADRAARPARRRSASRWPPSSAPPPGCCRPTSTSGSCWATPAPTCSGRCSGLAVVLETSRPVRTVVLVALVVLNLASERVSFSSVIDRTPGLRHLDRLGRRRRLRRATCDGRHRFGAPRTRVIGRQAGRGVAGGSAA